MQDMSIGERRGKQCLRKERIITNGGSSSRYSSQGLQGNSSNSRGDILKSGNWDCWLSVPLTSSLLRVAFVCYDTQVVKSLIWAFTFALTSLTTLLTKSPVWKQGTWHCQGIMEIAASCLVVLGTPRSASTILPSINLFRNVICSLADSKDVSNSSTNYS